MDFKFTLFADCSDPLITVLPPAAQLFVNTDYALGSTYSAEFIGLKIHADSTSYPIDEFTLDFNGMSPFGCSL